MKKNQFIFLSWTGLNVDNFVQCLYCINPSNSFSKKAIERLKEHRCESGTWTWTLSVKNPVKIHDCIKANEKWRVAPRIFSKLQGYPQRMRLYGTYIICLLIPIFMIPCNSKLVSFCMFVDTKYVLNYIKSWVSEYV